LQLFELLACNANVFLLDGHTARFLSWERKWGECGAAVHTPHFPRRLRQAATSPHPLVQKKEALLMSFTEHNVNGLIYDTSDVITAAGSGAVHAFTTRHGGVSPAPYDSLNFADNKGDTSENLLENYRLLGEAVGFDASRAVGCRQIHSDLVRIATEEDAGKILWDDRPYDADGLITNVPNLPLFAYGTDCCVITLYDPTSRSIGAVHAGWRGTASGIALKAAVSMMSCYGADPYTLRAAISPSIGKCCFETDSDVADAFFALLDPAMDERIEKRGDKYHIDLKAINRLWLLRAGIDPSRIDVHPDCTKCHPERYWSHRAMGDRRGGMAAMICLTEDAL
jgi:YfiH family protein